MDNIYILFSIVDYLYTAMLADMYKRRQEVKLPIN